MSRPTANTVAAALILTSAAVGAYPEGAPWGSANPGAAETCASCHYDYDPVHDSPALTIDGLPDTVVGGESYDFVIRLEGTDAAVSGFQLLIAAKNDDAGTIESDNSTIETIGASSRTTVPADATQDASWTLTWQAPHTVATPIRLYLAASAANDDQSPLGDTIHYRQFTICSQR